MPKLTPRQRLIEQVTARFQTEGESEQEAYRQAVLAVHAFYTENRDHPRYEVAAHEALGLIMEIIPPFVTHMRSAFEQVMGAMNRVTQAAQVAGPWVELAQRLRQDKPTPRYDASGLPIDEHPDRKVDLSVALNRQGQPCIEDGCYRTAEPDHAYCRECNAENNAQVADEVALADIGHPAGVFMVHPPSTDGSPTPNFTFIPPPPAVIELTQREWHLSVARRLRELGCTYADLVDMRDRRDFATAQHHSAWFAFGGTVDQAQLDRATFVLNGLEGEDGEPALVDLSDHDIERLERDYPTDRITGAPHHYVVNGDHSECGCGGHLVECDTWSDSMWRHAPSICGVRRQICTHTPRHVYREPCEDYAADPLQAVGRPQGCVAHGGPDCVCEVDDGPAVG